MKIIHFLTSIDKTSGGVTSYLELLSRELKNKVELIIATGSSVEPIEIKGVRVRFFNLSLKNILTISNEFRQFIVEEKPDIVHVNGIWEPCCWLFQKEAQKIGIKVVLSPHGMLEPYILTRNPWKKKTAMLLYQHKAIKNANYIHATANAEVKNIQRLGYKNSYKVIANGIDTSEVLSKQGYSVKDKIKLLFLSRVHPKKGIEFLIEAMTKIEGNNIELTIAGTGEETYVKGLLSLVKKNKLEDKIKFIGGVYGDDKWRLYHESTCFILPTYSENFGIVIAEALATGLPVITTKGTPWSELIKCNCGWWIDLSIKNIIDAINKISSLDKRQLSEMGENGKKLVQENYDITSVTNKMYQFYEQINKS